MLLGFVTDRIEVVKVIYDRMFIYLLNYIKYLYCVVYKKDKRWRDKEILIVFCLEGNELDL